MTYEVYAFKIVFFFLPENSVTVSITLSAFLLGLGFSTLISKRLLRKKKLGYKKLLQLHFLLFSLLCIICFGALNLPASVINLLGNYPIEESQLLLGKGILIWLILFLPALLVGGFFPSLLSKEVDENDGSKNLNKVYFFTYFFSI